MNQKDIRVAEFLVCLVQNKNSYDICWLDKYESHWSKESAEPL